MTTLDGVNGTVCSAQQYQLSLSSYDNPFPSFSCLTHGQSIGLVLTAEASFLSLVCVIILFIWIGWNARMYRKTFPNDDWKLFRGPSDIYMFSLFVFNILQAIGGILNVRWAHDGIVMTGHYCTAQGVVQQIGEFGVALVTLSLAVHTFVATLWCVGWQARGFALSVVGLACAFIAIRVGAGAGTPRIMKLPHPYYWCWISPEFPGERLASEYIWMWTALLASTLLYIPLYFWVEGRLLVDKKRWQQFRICRRNPSQGVEYPQKRAALGMILYPLAYSLVVLPLSVARWMLFSHRYVSSAVTFFGISTFNLSGAINVLLFLILRPRVVLFTRPETVGELEIGLHLDVPTLRNMNTGRL
ncbi:hypothetical protein BC826DRAFT_951332 [Russula brevipes]|nr:hypothetical protein BC826DRAFT_951332 [Russula brevipes]